MTYLNQLFIDVGVGWVFGGHIMPLCLLTGLSCLSVKETKGTELIENRRRRRVSVYRAGRDRGEG